MIKLMMIGIFLWNANQMAYANNRPKVKAQTAKTFYEHNLTLSTTPFLTKKVVDGEIRNVVIVDVRSAQDFHRSHIPGAINVPNFHKYQEDKHILGALNKDTVYYLYGNSYSSELPQIAGSILANRGYTFKVMSGGFHSWKEHGYPIVGFAIGGQQRRSQSVGQFYDQLNNYVSSNEINHDLAMSLPQRKFHIVDIRENSFYNKGHITSAVSIPWDDSFKSDSVKREHFLANFSKDKTNIVICHSRDCTLCPKAMIMAIEEGYHAQIMTGGWKKWEKFRFHVAR